MIDVPNLTRAPIFFFGPATVFTTLSEHERTMSAT
jgi:hypothetical protein